MSAIIIRILLTFIRARTTARLRHNRTIHALSKSLYVSKCILTQPEINSAISLRAGMIRKFRLFSSTNSEEWRTCQIQTQHKRLDDSERIHSGVETALTCQVTSRQISLHYKNSRLLSLKAHKEVQNGNDKLFNHWNRGGFSVYIGMDALQRIGIHCETLPMGFCGFVFAATVSAVRFVYVFSNMADFQVAFCPR